MEEHKMFYTAADIASDLSISEREAAERAGDDPHGGGVNPGGYEGKTRQSAGGIQGEPAGDH